MIRSGARAGAAIDVTLRFRDPEPPGPLIEVTEPVTVEVRPPPNDDGTERDIVQLVAVKLGTGTYLATFIATWPGKYVIRGESFGSTPGVAWEELEVRPSAV